MAACIAALFSGWAAWETRNGAHETARATRAAVWLQLLTEYASPEMLASMKGLRTWQQKNPKSFATDFEKLLTKGNKTAKETELEKQLDQDRRRVSQFFGKILVLSQLGVISTREIGYGWDEGTYSFLAEVWFPMEFAKSRAMIASGSTKNQDVTKAEDSLQSIMQFYNQVFHRPD